jgi:hypothetical protein
MIPTVSAIVSPPPRRGIRPWAIQEPDRDERQQRDDRQLKPAIAALLQREDRERDHRRDQPRWEQRDPEHQVQADRGAGELRQIGRHRDHLGLNPQHHVRALRERLTAHLREAAPGVQPQLGGQILDQDGHQVGHHDHPHQQIPVL